MTAKEMVNTIGKTGTLRVEELQIEVEILDIRNVWNRTDFLVSPISGQGEKWVSGERVKILEQCT